LKPRRPPSLPPVCVVFPDHSSFSVLRGTPTAFTRYHFKRLECYDPGSLAGHEFIRLRQIHPLPQRGANSLHAGEARPEMARKGVSCFTYSIICSKLTIDHL
jgi:hypothetical protein